MVLFDPHPILFESSWLTLYAHGLFFAIGAEVSVVIGHRMATKVGLSTEELTTRALWIFLSGLIGARLGDFLLYPGEFHSLTDVLAIWQGGLVSYFAIGAGALAFIYLFKHEKKSDRTLWFDVVAIATLAGWAVGRLGNYYAADSIGIEHHFFTLFYGRVPIQLFEALLCLGLALYGWRTISTSYKGLLGLRLLMGYALGRFFIDFWRDEGSALGLHYSQIASLLLGVIVFIIYSRWPKK